MADLRTLLQIGDEIGNRTFIFLGLILDESRSWQATVVSGVPQGTVLGPLFFLAFINNIPEAVRASNPRFLVNDCLLYKLINCDANAESVQQDLQALEEWEQKWQIIYW